MDTAKKIENEKEMVKCMIEIYCHKKHATKNNLCEDCNNLFDKTAVCSSFCSSKSFNSF